MMIDKLLYTYKDHTIDILKSISKHILKQKIRNILKSLKEESLKNLTLNIIMLKNLDTKINV